MAPPRPQAWQTSAGLHAHAALRFRTRFSLAPSLQDWSWYKLLSEGAAPVPQVPNPQQQNREVIEVTEVTPSYAAAPATKLIG